MTVVQGLLLRLPPPKWELPCHPEEVEERAPLGAPDSCATGQQNVLRGTAFHFPQTPSVGWWSGVLYEKWPLLRFPPSCSAQNKESTDPQAQESGACRPGSNGSPLKASGSPQGTVEARERLSHRVHVSSLQARKMGFLEQS